MKRMNGEEEIMQQMSILKSRRWRYGDGLCERPSGLRGAIGIVVPIIPGWTRCNTGKRERALGDERESPTARAKQQGFGFREWRNTGMRMEGEIFLTSLVCDCFSVKENI